MEQMFVCLLAEVKAKIRSSEQEMTAMLEEKIEANQEEIRKNQERMRAKLDAWLEKSEDVVELQEVRNDEINVAITGGLKDRYGERNLAVRRRQQPKKRTQGNGGSRKKLAATRRRMTRSAVPAQDKGCIHKRPGRDNFARATQKEGRSGKDDRQRHKGQRPNEYLCLESKNTLYKAVRQTIELEIAKRMIGSSIRLWRTSVGTLWRVRQPPKRKRTLLTAGRGGGLSKK
jgi:hypothetical protein